MAEGALKSEVKKHLGKLAVSHFATCDRGQPRVRPVTLIHKGGRIWIATDARSPKARQMRENPRVEACVSLVKEKYHGYIQITARAKEIRDVRERRAIGKYCGFIGTYWKGGVDDPNYALFRLEATLVRYMKPGEMETRKVKW